jgi:hypothetical protein
MQQHADDTTINAARTADAQVILTSSADLHCRAFLARRIASSLAAIFLAGSALPA